MNLQDRKIVLAQSLLRLNDEQIIESIEKLLKSLRWKSLDNDFKPMSALELNRRIEQSEKDFEEGRFITSDNLLKKFK